MAIDCVDFHCHLDLYPDFPDAVQECERRGIHTLAVTTTPRAWPRNRDLAAGTRHVRAALGIHPQLVGERESELSLWDEYLPQTRYVGEVGLDAGPKFYRSFDVQRRVFQHILTACARAGDKILSVHSVRSSATVLDMIRLHLPPSHGRVILHWFTGSRMEAERALELGCFFSINAAMLRNPRHRAVVAELPLDRVLTETDGPFTRNGDRPNRPADARAVVEMLAADRGMAADEIGRAIIGNLRLLEGSPS